MQAPVLKEPVSPCVGICRLDPSWQHCVGCMRTVDELQRWTSMTREEKVELLTELEQRRAAEEAD